MRNFLDQLVPKSDIELLSDELSGDLSINEQDVIHGDIGAVVSLSVANRALKALEG